MSFVFSTARATTKNIYNLYEQGSPKRGCLFFGPKKELKSIEIKIPKEIREYRESIFFGLSARQFFCSLLAVGASAGLYVLLRPIASVEEIGWGCILGAAPFAACGFFRYHGMTAEQFAWAWIKSMLLSSRRLVFRSSCLYAAACRNTIERGEHPHRKRSKP